MWINILQRTRRSYVIPNVSLKIIYSGYASTTPVSKNGYIHSLLEVNIIAKITVLYSIYHSVKENEIDQYYMGGDVTFIIVQCSQRSRKVNGSIWW